MTTPIFPPIPESTARSARAIYGRGNPYLYLGDRLDTILSIFEPKMLGTELYGNTLAFLALLTIIQFAEDLADNDLVESVQSRPDLKYALHLPDPSLRLSPLPLCVFRQKVLSDPSYRNLFKEIFIHIYPNLHFRRLDEDADINNVVISICINTIHASLFDAMLRSVEALSADQFVWFRRIAKPFWYERYSHTKSIFNTGSSIRYQGSTLEDIKADIQYLLQSVAQLDSQEVNEIEEIKILKRMWDKMSCFEFDNNCHTCLLNTKY